MTIGMLSDALGRCQARGAEFCWTSKFFYSDVQRSWACEAARGRGGLATAISLLNTLRSLPHGRWWPPLDELLDRARHFYAGGLAETQEAPV